ncbi:MAG: nucleotidyltransferase family protein [Allobaculum sp.]|uniref:nucleotidyltransferase family protein n=1 Tax=Allobaculum sp. TaxID=1872463 RepID=UPI00399A379E
MIKAGIIAEFNPFHDGHREIIRRVRETLHPDQIVVVLSTWYSSRGLPSLLSPQEKTRMAIEAGADLVIALPAAYAMQSADYFALYAIEALKCAGVNTLCFGSELADLAVLEEKSRQLKMLEAVPGRSHVQNAVLNGIDLRPNDILAVQYIRYARSFGMAVVPFPRNFSLKSATAIRKDFFANIPQKGDALYHPRQSWQSYYPYLRMQLLMSDPKRLSEFFLCEEGIEYRLIESARKSDTFEGFLKHAVSKTYTRARIQRTCMMILMQISKREMKEHPFFFKVLTLGFNDRGQALLKSLPGGLKAASRMADLSPWLQNLLNKEMRLYSLIDQKPAAWTLVLPHTLSACSEFSSSSTAEADGSDASIRHALLAELHTYFCPVL